MLKPLHSAHSCTAFEFHRAMEPHRVGLMLDPALLLAPAVRRAHVIAVLNGHDWSSTGKYPMDVWMKYFD